MLLEISMSGRKDDKGSGFKICGVADNVVAEAYQDPHSIARAFWTLVSQAQLALADQFGMDLEAFHKEEREKLRAQKDLEETLKQYGRDERQND